MTNDECIEKAKEFYAVLLSDFAAAQADYLADDVCWENPLPDNIPFGGIYYGAEGLLEYLVGINDAIEMSPLHFTDIIANDHVVSLIGVEENTLVRSTDKYYTMPFVHVVRFNAEGKVEHVREYNDTREMVAAFG
ncbi:MAG: nuclear transport factor 2 family protein [Pseudomonadales bacterium]|nr:nuclear transport factor 2 family protein [Pseudomonadales bacterium]MDG1442167.1 nuclear transport factor 2 family protein [Pseudomonadales bacterium]